MNTNSQHLKKVKSTYKSDIKKIMINKCNSITKENYSQSENSQ